MYNYVRLIISFLIFIIIYFFIKKKWGQVSKKRITGVILFSVICLILMKVIPVENLFVTYKSPEDVFSYLENGEIEEIIEGDESCLVVYSQRANKIASQLVPKSIDGYALPGIFSKKYVKQKFLKTEVITFFN